MKCPECSAPGRVKSSAQHEGYRRRRYYCPNTRCGHRYTTITVEKAGKITETIVRYGYTSNSTSAPIPTASETIDTK